MVRVVNFEEVYDELMGNFHRDAILPIIGSGFTRGCNSLNGKVPSGEDYKMRMIDEIGTAHALQTEEKNKLLLDPFSTISSIYHREVDKKIQRDYLRDNFTRVSLEGIKKQFLSLSWPYIYTLNIDDGIERNSYYSHIVYANREVNNDVFSEDKCVIKLHGDISEMLTYLDSESEILTQEQYIESLKKNGSLLSKLTHDSMYQNLLFIGCSLNDEIDLLSSFFQLDSKKNDTARYLCTTHTPSVIDKLKYERYGITHCIVFDSFDSIYEGITKVAIESKKIRDDDLDAYKSFNIKECGDSYEENKEYLLFGKGLIGKDHTITKPFFFISRRQSDLLLQNLETSTLQLLVASRCSGKTYILSDIACRIRNRDVFYFETKDRLSNQAFERLLEKENCVILADNSMLSIDQFETILNRINDLKNNHISIVVVINKNDRDIHGLLKLYDLQSIISLKSLPHIEVSNILSKSEVNIINPLLAAVDAGLFSSNRSIVDNIIEIGESLEKNNKYHKIKPYEETVKEIAALIALGIERKVYSYRAVQFDIQEELIRQCKKSAPLIDCESTWSFEQSPADNSPLKYVINAEYWLYNQLYEFARTEANHKIIVDAYKYIVSKIIEQEGRPNILFGNNRTLYKQYILFDNINRLFSGNGASGKEGILLIGKIYEGLNRLLSSDPNYMHQRAKCYIKASVYEKTAKCKVDYLNKAYRDANVALQIFSKRYDERANEKLKISRDHVIYTMALVLCHRCAINSYTDSEENTTAILRLHDALVSPYNTYAFIKRDQFNYGNVVKALVVKMISKPSLVFPEARQNLEDLFQRIG